MAVSMSTLLRSGEGLLTDDSADASLMPLGEEVFISGNRFRLSVQQSTTGGGPFPLADHLLESQSIFLRHGAGFLPLLPENTGNN